MRPLLHFAVRSAEIIASTLFLSAAGRVVWRHATRMPEAEGPQLPRAAVLAHVYYPELLPEVLSCAANIPGSPDLHVTTVAERADDIRRRLAGMAKAHVHVFPNRGRDIAPFLALLGDGTLDGYDAVLKLHTKRSPHLVNGGQRRRMLFATLSGTPGVARRVLGHFTEPRTGIVGSSLAFRRRTSWWMGNRDRCLGLCGRMTPPATAEVAFFEGSMFWFRPVALAPLAGLSLRPEDFEVEPSPTDGALHHAVERLFCLAARAGGHATLSVSGRTLLA